ncbi:MAG: hypothetical protein ABWZ80_00530 [Beijerinckiaceae bacterium]
MARGFILPAMIAVATLLAAACAPRRPVVDAAPKAVASDPSVFITAPGTRVRAVIAARAQSRGTTVASNTPQGVILERALAQSPEALEAQCGPHQPGRLIRVVLSTANSPGGTTVTEQRFIVDGADVCPVTLTPAEVEQANAALQETRNQVLGVPGSPAASPAAPATPRT